MPSQEAVHDSAMKAVLPLGQGTLDLAVTSAARRPDPELARSRRRRGDEAAGQPGSWGVCEPALKPREAGKSPGSKAKVSNRPGKTGCPGL
jgi:hypothetical protein